MSAKNDAYLKPKVIGNAIYWPQTMFSTKPCAIDNMKKQKRIEHGYRFLVKKRTSREGAGLPWVLWVGTGRK